MFDGPWRRAAGAEERSCSSHHTDVLGLVFTPRKNAEKSAPVMHLIALDSQCAYACFSTNDFSRFTAN